MSTQIKDLAIVKTIANDGDFLVAQSSTTGETYRIAKSDLVADAQVDFSTLPEVLEVAQTDYVIVQIGSNTSKISRQNLFLVNYLKWGLRETSGTAAIDTSGNTGTAAIDTSGNNRNGTYNNCILSADGATLNGTNSIIWANTSNSQLNPLVVKIAFKTNISSKSQGIWEFRDTQNTSGGSYTPALRISSTGKLSIYGFPNGTTDSPLSYNDNQWHTAVCAFESNRIRLFADKVKIFDITGIALQSFTGFFSLGYSKTSNYYAGNLKDFQVWNSLFSDAQGIAFS